MSGLALSSLRQKAISSAITATAVIPRIVRKLAGLMVMSTPLASEIVSAVSFSRRSFRFGAVAKMPETKLKACAACTVLAARIGSTPRSPGASVSRWSTQPAI